MTAIHVLLLVALLELAVGRIAVPLLRPIKGPPPAWHVALDYLGLFLQYFAFTLALIVLAVRCHAVLAAAWQRRASEPARYLAAHVGLAIAAACAAILFIHASTATTLLIELAFALAVIGLVVAVIRRGHDLGVQVGTALVAVPLLLHTLTTTGRAYLWPESNYDGIGLDIVRYSLLALAIAALATPYCFAPRPFSRAVTRPLPVIFAMGVAALGAVLARLSYYQVTKVAKDAVGIELDPLQADPKLALYLLALATLAWTLASCMRAASAARRTIGMGLALVVVGGYRFGFPHEFLLPLVGLTLVVEAARHVRDEELAAMPISNETPPIDDATWAAYIGTVMTGLKRSLDSVHSLTTRGDGGLTSSIIVGDARGLDLRTRIDRIDGCVLALDVVVGREVDESRTSSLTLWAHPAGHTGSNPAGPPAAPALKSGDASFDERFKIRGSAPALAALLDDHLRARATASLDGWLAYWEGQGVRYRVYPGRGAPLDHPLPLSDLALRKVPSPERLVAIIELLVEIGARVIAPPADEPASASTGEDLEAS